MEIKTDRKRLDAVFISSSARYEQLPAPTGEEFAILGRSNVGKSSFINHALEKNNLAKTSRTPGKTALANLFQVDSGMVWIDLPGYGYARAPGEEKDRWSKLIAKICEERECLGGIIWLIDIRHIGVKADVVAYEWLQSTRRPLFPVLTKADKLSSSQKKQHLRDAVEFFKFQAEPVVYSVEDHSSRHRFWTSFDRWRQCQRELRLG
jgi:GTP-binding protein